MDDRDNDPVKGAALLDSYGIKNAWASVVRGDAFAAQRDFPAAFRSYGESLAMIPWNVHALHRLARAYLEAGQEENARNAWREALRLNPKFQPARDGLLSIEGTPTKR
jgi:tetratricopeptide (TPR) repeat protein